MFGLIITISHTVKIVMLAKFLLNGMLRYLLKGGKKNGGDINNAVEKLKKTIKILLILIIILKIQDEG